MLYDDDRSEQGNGADEHEAHNDIERSPDQPIDMSKLSRRDERSLIFHLLYAMDAFEYDASLESIIDNFARGFNVIIDPRSELFKKAAAMIAERQSLDQEIQPLLANWRLDRLGCAIRLILRMALWELKYTDTASTIVINEAIELAKCFAEHDAYKFINGVLDKWVGKTLPEEASSDNPEQV